MYNENLATDFTYYANKQDISFISHFKFQTALNGEIFDFNFTQDALI